MTARVENPNQHGPRGTEACLASRYWLTEKGIAATDAIRAAQAAAADQSQEARP